MVNGGVLTSVHVLTTFMTHICFHSQSTLKRSIHSIVSRLSAGSGNNYIPLSTLEAGNAGGKTYTIGESSDDEDPRA